jgi:hypothetical protein
MAAKRGTMVRLCPVHAGLRGSVNLRDRRGAGDVPSVII